MELKGRLEQKLEVEKGTSKAGKDWQKQTIIIDNGDQYNPKTAISFFAEEKVKMLEKFNIGQEITVGVNISSREFNGRWYNEISGWKISEATASTPNPTLNESETDDLPF